MSSFTSSIAIHFQASTSSGFITGFRHNNQSLHDQTHALSNHYQTGLINKMKKSLSSVLKPFLQTIFYYQHQYYSPLPLMTATGISQRAENGILMSTLLQHDFILLFKTKQKSTM
jgi:hypothetical protein